MLLERVVCGATQARLAAGGRISDTRECFDPSRRQKFCSSKPMRLGVLRKVGRALPAQVQAGAATIPRADLQLTPNRMRALAHVG